VLELNDEALVIPHEARPLARMIARSLDAYELDKAGHSSAI
jgi:oxygen-independent coproporphyrinogen-3 oxidase